VLLILTCWKVLEMFAMRHRPQRSHSGVARLLCIALLALSTLVACSNPVGGDDDPAAKASPGTTPTPAPAMKVVTPTAVVAGAPTATNSAGAQPPTQNPATYVVAEGDTLYQIAVKFGVELDALISLNGLSDPNDIQVGQELKIPPRP